MSFITNGVYDQNIVIIIVIYLCCNVAKAAMTLGLTSSSWLLKSRAGWSLAAPKAGGELFTVCWSKPRIIAIQDIIQNVWKSFSNVGINLSHSNYKGSICLLCLVLIYLTSLFASHINASCALLVWMDLQN